MMISWCGGIEQFRGIQSTVINDNGVDYEYYDNNGEIISINKVLKKGRGRYCKWPVIAISLLVSRASQILNQSLNVQYINANLLVDVHLLYKSLERRGEKLILDTDFPLFYRILYFLRKHPLANSQIEISNLTTLNEFYDGKDDDDDDDDDNLSLFFKNAESQKSSSETKFFDGIVALAGLGGLISISCLYDCQCAYKYCNNANYYSDSCLINFHAPNVNRRLNLATGHIEYITTRNIMPGEELVIDCSILKGITQGNAVLNWWCGCKLTGDDDNGGRIQKKKKCSCCCVDVDDPVNNNNLINDLQQTLNQHELFIQRKQPYLPNHVYAGFIQQNQSGENYFNFYDQKGNRIGWIDRWNNYWVDILTRRNRRIKIKIGFIRKEVKRKSGIGKDTDTGRTLYCLYTFPDKGYSKEHIYCGYFEGLLYFRQRTFKPIKLKSRNIYVDDDAQPLQPPEASRPQTKTQVRSRLQSQSRERSDYDKRDIKPSTYYPIPIHYVQDSSAIDRGGRSRGASSSVSFINIGHGHSSGFGAYGSKNRGRPTLGTNTYFGQSRGRGPNAGGGAKARSIRSAKVASLRDRQSRKRR